VKSFLIALSAASALFLNVCSLAPAATLPPNATQMEALHYLIGTWHCTWPSKKGVQSEDQIFESALGGAWLAEKEVMTGADGQPVVASVHYTGYDPATGRFMHVGPDADGTYEIAQSEDGNVWHDVNDANATFVHTKVSDTSRTMVQHYQAGGKPMTFFMTCKKTE
jgi:hypothetical protein